MSGADQVRLFFGGLAGLVLLMGFAMWFAGDDK